MADQLPPPEERGATTIADKVVERVATYAAGEVAHPEAGRTGLGRLVARDLPRASAVVAGSTSRIKVEVAAPWPTPLSALAAEVRDHVSERVTALTGVAVTAVDVSVADVVHVQSTHRRVQ